jgi:hypothetical protein
MFEDYSELFLEKYEKLNIIPCRNVRYGWSKLQISTLAECIQIAEANEDSKSIIYLCAMMLRQFYRFLKPDDQKVCFEKLHKQVLFVGPTNVQKLGLKSLICQNDFNVLGLLCLRNMIFCKQDDMFEVIQHKKVTNEKQKDVFLYNPYTKSKNDTKQMFLVREEPFYVDVTIANPLGIDVAVEELSLLISGVNATLVTVSTIIPAHSNSFVVRLSAIPVETGTLCLEGIQITIMSGTLTETLRAVNVLSLQQSERERLGKEVSVEQRLKAAKMYVKCNEA